MKAFEVGSWPDPADVPDKACDRSTLESSRERQRPGRPAVTRRGPYDELAHSPIPYRIWRTRSIFSPVIQHYAGAARYSDNFKFRLSLDSANLKIRKPLMHEANMVNRRLKVARPLGMAAVVSLLAACNQTTMGGGSTVSTGSAGAAGTQGASTDLRKCAEPIGTAALVESESRRYLEYDLPSPTPMIRLMMQQSNCFKVVDRGAASDALKAERELAGQGELRKGSNMGGGQMAAADFLITPRVIFQDANSGGGGGVVGSLLPGVAGAVAGGLSVQNMEAQTLLTLTNVRTSVQEAAAEGSASKSDIGLGGIGFIGPVAGGAGAYESTDIGKIVTAAFMDAHNKLVQQLGATQPSSERAATSNWHTVSALNLRSGPNTGAPVIETLRKGTSVTPTGKKRGAWWQVEANGNQGWVSSDYITQ